MSNIPNVQELPCFPSRWFWWVCQSLVTECASQLIAAVGSNRRCTTQQGQLDSFPGNLRTLWKQKALFLHCIPGATNFDRPLEISSSLVRENEANNKTWNQDRHSDSIWALGPRIFKTSALPLPVLWASFFYLFELFWVSFCPLEVNHPDWPHVSVGNDGDKSYSEKWPEANPGLFKTLHCAAFQLVFHRHLRLVPRKWS